jgi:hypothetical protein
VSGPTPRSGCLVCGAALAYADRPTEATCALCGVAARTPVRCEAGHFVCDECHAAPARELIERTCLASDAVDPMALASTLMRHPSVKLHGPEHHFLVPAVLLAAHANATGAGREKGSRLAEARRRADQVPGGSCGFQGACGAGVGVGIFASVVTGATPRATIEWGAANVATGEALVAIGRVGGPRCCKRTAWLAILSGVRFAREVLGVALPARTGACEWGDLNAECLGARCPFRRAEHGARLSP